MTEQTAKALQKDWQTGARWKGVKRTYTAEDVVRLRGSVQIEHTLARLGAEKLWKLVNTEPYVNCLGALTGGQAMQQVKAGLKAIYLSGWQVAADNNSYLAMYPDQSLYPVNSVPAVVERINGTFKRADEIQCARGIRPGSTEFVDYFAPIVADAEAGFGGVLNAFELMKAMIRAGAAGVHFEDQLASVKKCGHMGGKVLVPTQEAVQKLIAARLAADVSGVPTVLLARTDAEAADLLTSDVDENDKPHCTGERTPEGFYRTRPGVAQAISRGLAYAPYADMVWCETGKPDLEFARQFAEAIRTRAPGQAARVQLLAVVQLEEEPRRRHDREVPARARRDGLQVPVHHAGGHSLDVVQHVRPGAEVRRAGHDRVRRESAGARVRGARSRLHVRLAPAGSGHGLLRRRHDRDPGWRLVGGRAQGLDRRGAVQVGARLRPPGGALSFDPALPALPAAGRVPGRDASASIPAITARRSRRSAMCEPRLLIVGLAPGLHGANATGRPFTGDHAGNPALPDVA